jgi:hypothetical protein
MLRLFALTVLLCASTTAAAHHGMTMFDFEATITLDGVVTQYEWRNPHVYVYVEVLDDTGDRVVWEVEGQPPASLRRQGWSADSLAVGDRVVVNAAPARNPERRFASGRALLKADGSRLAMGFDPAALSDVSLLSPSKAESLAGAWATVLKPTVAMPILVGPVARPDLQRRNPFDWPLTAAGRAAAVSYRQESMHPGLECIPHTAPFFMVFPDIKTIEIEDDVIRIRSEFEGVERIVRMDVRSHDGVSASLQGHSIGWWENDVLVVDTARFAEHRVGNATGLPSSTRKHLVERFALNPDRERLTYRFELEDPEYLAAPVIREVEWVYQPHFTYAPAACDPENARRFLGN